MKQWGICPGCDKKLRLSRGPERWVEGVQRVTLVLVSGHQCTVTLCADCAPCTPEQLPRIWHECVEGMAKIENVLATSLFRYDVPLGPLFSEPYPPPERR